MFEMGLRPQEYQKLWCFAGHERPDLVLCRNKFIIFFSRIFSVLILLQRTWILDWGQVSKSWDWRTKTDSLFISQQVNHSWKQTILSLLALAIPLKVPKKEPRLTHPYVLVDLGVTWSNSSDSQAHWPTWAHYWLIFSRRHSQSDISRCKRWCLVGHESAYWTGQKQSHPNQGGHTFVLPGDLYL